MANNRIIDLFCGCGGMSKGFEMAGFKVVFAIDSWDDAIETYNKNIPGNVGVVSDIYNFSEKAASKLKDITGIIGGPPCQGFSTVGKRDVHDVRNQLYLQYFRIVKAINPSFFVLENVRGMLTLEDGAFLKNVLSVFKSLGYRVNFSILNAADYGVPQNRNRVFFVGLKDVDFVFPKPHKQKVTTKEALDDLPRLDETAIQQYRHDPENLYQQYVRGNSEFPHNNEPTIHSQQTIDIISRIPDGGSIFDLPAEFWAVRHYNKSFERMKSDGQSNTIDTGHRNYFLYSENRIPTVREAARIQSFQDDFIFTGSRTSQYKQVGNAVPPLLAYSIAKEIKKYL